MKVDTNVGTIKAKPEVLDEISTFALFAHVHFEQLAWTQNSISGIEHFLKLSDSAKKLCDEITQALIKKKYYDAQE